MHRVEMQNRVDLIESRASLYALLEELVDRGVIDLATFEARRETARVLENERGDKLPRAYLDNSAPDKYALKVLPDVPCAELLPICQARCCKLVFALSRQDVEEGVIEWEIDQPYLIRHGENGRCVHQDGGGKCGAYQHRPAACRTFDCRTDKRIWGDFEKRIVAGER